MLILTRRPTQKLMIGPTVAITVLEIVGNKVRLGISAPRDVPIRGAATLVTAKPDSLPDRNS
jgi:carbon storage regulator CsrA